MGLRGTHHVLILLIAVAVTYFGFTQTPVSLNDGHPLDAQEYHSMAEQVAVGESISALRPHAYRVGLPFLVGAFFPDDIAFGFRLLNLFFAFAMASVFYLYLRSCRLDADTTLLLVLALVCAPQSPYRFVHFIPAYTDPPVLFLIVLLLYLGKAISRLDLRWSLVVTALGVVGVLFREIALCGLLTFVFAQCFRFRQAPPFLLVRSWRNVGLCVLPLVASSLTLALVHLLIDGTGEYEYLTQIQRVVSTYAAQPSIFLLAFLTAFGVIPLLLLVAHGPLRNFLSENHDVAVFLVGCVLLALFGGFNTDRIVFWSFPAVLLLFGVLLEQHPLRHAPLSHKLAFYLPLFAAQALAWRVWLPIPDATHMDELSNPGAPPILLLSAFGDVTLGHIYSGLLPASARLTLLWQFILAATYFAIVLRLAVGRKLSGA